MQREVDLALYSEKIRADRPGNHHSRPIHPYQHLLTAQRIAEFKQMLLPRKILLDTINICNANCVFCAYQYNSDRKLIMPLSLVKKIAQDIKDLVPEAFVSLTPTVGDPLLDPDIFQKVKILKEAGISRVQFYTNGIALKDRLDELLASSLDNLEISLSDLSEENYLRIFRVNKYHDVLHSVSALLKRVKMQNHRLPIKLNFRSHLKLVEIYQQDDFKKHILPHLTPRVFLAETQTFDNWMGLIKQDDLPAGMLLAQDQKETFKLPCRRLVDLQILATGEVRICGCRAKDTVFDDLIIGNLQNQTLKEIWESEKLLQLWDTFFNGNYPKACQSCNYYSPLNDRPDRSYLFKESSVC